MSLELPLELLAKSGVIAGAGLLLSVLLNFRSPTERVDVLRATACILLGLPLIMALAPGLQLALLPSTPVEAAALQPVIWQGSVTPVEGLSLYGSIPRPSLVGVLAGVWTIGALAVFGRFVLGVLTLRRWTRSGAPVSDPVWIKALERLARDRRPRLVASPKVEAPLSWGLPPGVVLIGQPCLARPENADAVMAHELAHIRRRDWLFLGLSRLALALFWFNPLVWLLHAELANRTEDAADAAALAAVDRRTYARTLVGLAAGFRQPAAIGMAGDAQSLTRRITRIMTNRPAARPRPLTMALAIGALVAIATPIAAVEITQRAPLPPAAPSAPPAPPARVAPPRLQDGDRITISDNGQTRTYRSVEEMDPETRRSYEAAMREAAEARVQAAHARDQARVAVAEAARVRTEARVHHAAAMEQARAATAEARAAAAGARVQAAAAREEARHAMARARVEMRNGADQMDRGARQMRDEAVRLGDPAYRARQIEENRARGNTITDAELIELSRRLPEQAEEMERQAQRMREQSADRT
jgi:beta-lactamase regulating signal transducer with metallopeptidase domain